jgi:hypothetical protein
MVRYLYSLVDRIMSIMQGTNQSMIQDVQIYKSQTTSSVSKVECYVCGKGLSDGHSISAKTLKHGTVLFCNIHYSLQ